MKIMRIGRPCHRAESSLQGLVARFLQSIPDAYDGLATAHGHRSARLLAAAHDAPALVEGPLRRRLEQLAEARAFRVARRRASRRMAQAEADRLLDLYKAERERYEVSLPLSDAWAGDVGLTMTLVHPRLGFAGGKPFSILGRVDDYQSERVRFSLWG